VPSTDLGDTAPASAEIEPAVEETIADEPAGDTAEAASDGQPKRKRSRRGSRGGKRRRKPAANGDETTASDVGDAVADVAVDATPADGPPAYVPMSEWIEDFDAAKRA
jgi:hypothetical protein